MNSRTAETDFVQFLSQAGMGPGLPAPAPGFDALLRFYATVRAADCPVDADGDLLLFEWGPYDEGDGPHDIVSLTRQLLAEGGEDEDLVQLTLTYRMPPGSMLGGVEPDGIWCFSPEDLEGFRARLVASPAYLQLLEHPEAVASLTCMNAG